MTPDQRQRVQQLREARQRKQETLRTEPLLSRLESARWLGVRESRIPTVLLRAYVVRWDTPPRSQISDEASTGAIAKWLAGLWEEAGLGSEVLVSAGGLGPGEWTLLEFTAAPSVWLREVRDLLRGEALSFDLLLLRPDGRSCLAFSEEEYVLQAFLLDQAMLHRLEEGGSAPFLMDPSGTQEPRTGD